MNLSHLYYFHKLAELQHYTQAAQELYITQPTLSGAISCLEAELGISLFQKRGRNIFLTKYGKEFYDYVNISLRELDMGIAVAKEHAGDLGGTVDIGSISTIQGDYLPMAIQSFLTEKAAHVTFNIYQAQTNDIVKNIKADQYDVGFCTLVQDEHDLCFVPIVAQPLIAVVSKEHPLANTTALTFEELRSYPLISYQTEQPVGRNVKELLKHYDLSAKQHYSDEVTLCGIAMTELSVAVLLKTPSLRQFDDLSIISLPQVPAEFHIVHMVYNRNRYKSRAVNSFIDFITTSRSYVPTLSAH